MDLDFLYFVFFILDCENGEIFERGSEIESVWFVVELKKQLWLVGFMIVVNFFEYFFLVVVVVFVGYLGEFVFVGVVFVLFFVVVIGFSFFVGMGCVLEMFCG